MTSQHNDSEGSISEACAKSRVAEVGGDQRLSPAPLFGGRASPIAHGPEQSLGGLLASGTEARSSALEGFWAANKPAIFVALSQLFGALMNLSARLLELDGQGMHPVQMLLLRHGVTSICCLVYMWWTKFPGSLFGEREIRWLLLARGCTGFFGIFGVWWSMMYLPLADATVISFLAPGVAGFACYFLLKEPFTRLEQTATLVALMGVVLIARPAALFAGPSDDSDGRFPPTDAGRLRSSIPGADHKTTPRERLIAVGVALLGVLGAAGAFTTIRAIGKRAHPLITVNVFAMISTVICVTSLVLGPILNIGQPSLRWTAPASVKQWSLLLSLGVFGFIMQYLLTAGLALDKSNRANAMVYTHMLFAASFDWWVFGHRMELMSFAGCTLILGSAICVVCMKDRLPGPKTIDLERSGNTEDEAEMSPMLVSVSGAGEDIQLTRI